MGPIYCDGTCDGGELAGWVVPSYEAQDWTGQLEGFGFNPFKAIAGVVKGAAKGVVGVVKRVAGPALSLIPGGGIVRTVAQTAAGLLRPGAGAPAPAFATVARRPSGVAVVNLGLALRKKLEGLKKAQQLRAAGDVEGARKAAAEALRPPAAAAPSPFDQPAAPLPGEPTAPAPAGAGLAGALPWVLAGGAALFLLSRRGATAGSPAR